MFHPRQNLSPDGGPPESDAEAPASSVKPEGKSKADLAARLLEATGELKKVSSGHQASLDELNMTGSAHVNDRVAANLGLSPGQTRAGAPTKGEMQQELSAEASRQQNAIVGAEAAQIGLDTMKEVGEKVGRVKDAGAGLIEGLASGGKSDGSARRTSERATEAAKGPGSGEGAGALAGQALGESIAPGVGGVVGKAAGSVVGKGVDSGTKAAKAVGDLAGGAMEGLVSGGKGTTPEAPLRTTTEAPDIPDSSPAGAEEASSSSATRGVNKGRRSALQKKRDAARSNHLTGEFSQDDLAGQIAAGTIGAAENFARNKVFRPANAAAAKILYSLPVVGGFIRQHTWGSLLSGCLSVVSSGPLGTRILDRFMPKKGVTRFAANCGCGCAQATAAQCGCDGCCACSGGGTLCLPALVILLIILLIGSTISAQPGFTSEVFCEQNGIGNCTAAGLQLTGQTSDISSMEMLAYKTAEDATGVPWFYIAAWEKVATNYGTAPTRASTSSQLKSPAFVTDAAQLALESQISSLYPALKGLPEQTGPPIADAGSSASPTPSSSASSLTPECTTEELTGALPKTFTQSYFSYTVPGRAGIDGGSIAYFQSPLSFLYIHYSLAGQIDNEQVFISGSGWQRSGDSGSWTQQTGTVAAPMDITNEYALTSAADFKSDPKGGVCTYTDLAGVLMLQISADGLPLYRHLSSGVNAQYDYSVAAPVVIAPPTGNGSVAPSSAPVVVASSAPSLTASPVPLPTLSADQQSQLVAAGKLRDALSAQIKLQQSDARGGSFGPFLLTADEYKYYNALYLKGKPAGTAALDPFDEQDSALIIAMHIADVYNNTLRFEGAVSFPGIPLSSSLDPAMESWISLHYQDPLEASYVTAAIAALYQGKVGWAQGPDQSWTTGPRVGQKVTTAERYAICTHDATRKDCAAFAVNASALALPDIGACGSDLAKCDFATVIKSFYDPSQAAGKQVSDFGSLQVLMGALLSDSQLWGSESQAVFMVEQISDGGQDTGNQVPVNAYARAIDTYALSLYNDWATAKTTVSGINGVNSLDDVEINFWKPALTEAAARYGIPWQYLAATAHADNLFACVSNYPANIVDDIKAQAIRDGTDKTPVLSGVGIYDGSYLYAANPTGLNNCWRVGVGTAVSWGASSAAGHQASEAQAATNACGNVTGRSSFNTLNGSDTNCGSITVQMLGSDGTLHSATFPVTDFCDCMTGVTNAALAIDTAETTESIVKLNDAALAQLGWSDSTAYAAKPQTVIVYPGVPASNPTSWSYAFTGLKPISDAEATTALKASSSSEDPVRDLVMNKLAEHLIASLPTGVCLAPSSGASPSGSGATASSSASRSGSSPSASSGASSSGSSACVPPTLVDWWKAWQTYSGCALGTAQAQIVDPATGDKLGSAPTCAFIDTANDWLSNYIVHASGGGFISSSSYTPPFVSQVTTNLITQARANGAPGYGEVDCTFTSALMLINKITGGQVDVSTPAQVASEVLTWRTVSGGLYSLASTNGGGTPNNIVNGADSIYNIQLPYRWGGSGTQSLTWGQLLDWLDEGNGAEVAGAYHQWSSSVNPGFFQYAIEPGFANSVKGTGHAIYLDRRDPQTGKIWVMDPLGTGAYQGQWIPDDAIHAFLTGPDNGGWVWGTDSAITAELASDRVAGFNVPDDQYNKSWTPPKTVATTSYADTVAGAQAYTTAQIGAKQSDCLWQIANLESSLRVTVYNAGGSGAYGLWQAKPPSKMAPFGTDYMTSALTQSKWAIAYANDRYGSACQALSFKLANGWW